MRDNTSRKVLRSLRLAVAWLGIAGAATVGFGSLAGCKDDKKSETEVAASKAKEVAPSGPIDALEVPDGVVFFGGTDNLLQLATKAGTVGGPLGTAAINGPQVAKGLADNLGVTDTSVLALDKPLRFAVVDPKEAKEPLTVIVATTDPKALPDKLPQNKKADVEGNAFSYENAGKTFYLNFIDDYAVFSQDPKAFGKQKAFFVKLIGATVSAEGTAVVSVENASRIYATELDQSLEKMKSEIASQSQPGAAGLGEMANWVGSTAKEMKRCVISLGALADGGRISVTVTAKTGSDLDKTLASLGKRELKLLDKLPADAPLAFVGAIDPDKAGDLTRGLTAWALQISLGDELQEKYVTAMKDYWKATTGEVAFAAHKVPGAEGLEVSALYGIRDAESARASQTLLRELYQDEKLKKTHEELGLTMTFEPAAYKVGDVPVDRIKTTFKEGAPGSPADLQKSLGPAAGLFGDMMNSHIAIGPELGVMVYGEDGKGTVEAWLEGKMPGGFAQAAGVKRALENAAPGLFMVLYGAPVDVFREMQQGNAGGANLPASKNGLAITAGAEKGTLHLVLDLPTEQVQALMGLGMMLQGPGGRGL